MVLEKAPSLRRYIILVMAVPFVPINIVLSSSQILNNFQFFAQCVDENEVKHKIGLLRNQKDEFLCSINGEKSQRLADLVSHIPVQIFTPQSSDVLLGAPNQRRRYMDWGLFHVEPSFYIISLQYIKILKQRNALLNNFKITINR